MNQFQFQNGPSVNCHIIELGSSGWGFLMNSQRPWGPCRRSAHFWLVHKWFYKVNFLVMLWAENSDWNRPKILIDNYCKTICAVSAFPAEYSNDVCSEACLIFSTYRLFQPHNLMGTEKNFISWTFKKKLHKDILKTRQNSQRSI